MRNRRKKIGYGLLFLSVLFVLEGALGISGSVIGMREGLSILQLVGIVLFIASSLLILSQKRSLEAIVIPTGNKANDEARAKKAAEEYRKRNPKKVIVSGTKKRDKGHRRIYDILEENNVDKDKIETNNASNTLENVPDSFRDLEGPVEIVSYRSHLNRIKKIVNYLKNPPQKDEDYRLPKDLEVRYVDTGSETFVERIYESLAFFNENNRLSKGVGNALKMGKRNIFEPFKKTFNSLYNYFKGK